MKGLALVLAAAACAHSTPTNQPKPGPVDDIALLPADSEIVIGVHFGQLKSSAAWQTYVAPRLANADLPGLREVTALCGFNPLDRVESITLAFKGIAGQPSGAAVVHGLDRASSTSCFDADLGGIDKAGVKVQMAGDVALLSKGDVSAGFTFVDDSTLFYVVSPEATTADAVKAMAHAGTSLRTSQAFVEMYDKIDHNASVWMLANGGGSAMRKLGLPFKLRAAFGSVNVTDGIAFDLHLRATSPDEATQALGLIKQAENYMRQATDTLTLASEGADVKLAGTMGRQKLQQVVAMITNNGGGGAPDGD